MDRFGQNLKLMALCPGFFQKVCGSGLSGEQKDLALREFAAGDDCGFNAGHSGHNDVADEHIRLKALKRLDGLLSAEDSACFESGLIQDDCECISDHLFVICYKNPRFYGSGDCWLCHAEFSPKLKIN